MNRRPDKLTVAKRACRILSAHLRGTIRLDPHEIEVYKGIIENASRDSFYFFAKCVLGFNKLLPHPHRKWADDLQKNWLAVNYFGRLKPRGTYKTTLYGEAFVLWVWATVSPRIRFAYTSANQALLDEISTHLDHFIGEKSESLYAFVFGIRRDPMVKNTEGAVNIIGRDASAKGFSLTFRTAGGSTNGLHPHIIIIDDPCDKDDRESRATRESKKIWFDSLIPLLVPFELQVFEGDKVVKTVTIKKMMFIATRWHMDDVIAYVMGKPDWQFEIEGVYDANGKPAYPDLLPEEKIKELKGQISEIFFACQYLNNPLPEGTRIFELDRLHFIRPEQYDVRQGTNYCFFDPSQGKDGSDFPAVIWINLFNGRRVLFHAIDKKVGLTPLIGLIASLNKEHNVRVLAFETNGTMGMEENLARAHRDVGHNLAIESMHETRNKVERIMASQPDLYNGQLLFRDDHKTAYPEMMNQVLFFPAWKNDDFPDVIEKAINYLNQFSLAEFAKTGTSGGPAKRTLAGSIR